MFWPICPLINDVETDHQAMVVPISAATGYSSYVGTAGVRKSFTSKVGLELGGRFDLPYRRHFRFTTFPFLRMSVSLSARSMDRLDGAMQGNVVLNPPSLPQNFLSPSIKAMSNLVVKRKLMS